MFQTPSTWFVLVCLGFAIFALAGVVAWFTASSTSTTRKIGLGIFASLIGCVLVIFLLKTNTPVSYSKVVYTPPPQSVEFPPRNGIELPIPPSGNPPVQILRTGNDPTVKVHPNTPQDSPQKNLTVQKAKVVHPKPAEEEVKSASSALWNALRKVEGGRPSTNSSRSVPPVSRSVPQASSAKLTYLDSTEQTATQTAVAYSVPNPSVSTNMDRIMLLGILVPVLLLVLSITAFSKKKPVLGGGLLLVLLVLVFGFMLVSVRMDTSSRLRMPNSQESLSQIGSNALVGERPSPSPPVSPLPPKPPVLPYPSSTESPKKSGVNAILPRSGSDVSSDSSPLVESLSRVLAKMILSDREYWQNLVSRATQQMEKTASDEKSSDLKGLVLVNGEWIPRPKPDWVEMPPRRIGNNHEMSVTVGPYVSLEECNKHLLDAVQQEIGKYFAENRYQKGYRIQITPSMVQNMMVDHWQETKQFQVGKMVSLHVRLRFNDVLILANDLKHNSEEWMIACGLFFAVAWGALALFWGYLKARGNRPVRLLIVSSVGIILLVVVILSLA